MSSTADNVVQVDDACPAMVSPQAELAGEVSSNSASTVLVGIAVWVGTAVYLLSFVERGWIPHDEGLLAHSAERVLTGELPHQDFDDCYTGGLAFLHSLSFRLFGIHLSAMRWTLFGATMLFVPFLYLLALRCCTPVVAGLVTLVCVTWSVPNYFASMPSWYILFLTVVALYALTRFAESDSRKSLLAAGLCCGFAVLCKINGLFTVAMGLLFLLYHDQIRSKKDYADERSLAVCCATTVVAFTWSALVFLLLRRQLDSALLINLMLPSVAASSLLSWNEWANGRGTLSQRLYSLTKDVSIFLLGACAPITACLIPYLLNGTVAEVVNGVFILPQQRLENATQSFPPLFTFIVTVPTALLLFSGWSPREAAPARERRVTIAVLVFIGTALLCSWSWAVHSAVWLSVRLLPPLATAAVAIYVIKHTQYLSHTQRERLVLLFLGTTTLSLIQFPFAANIYFCYFAPLLILMVVQFRSMVACQAGRREAGVLVFFLLFAVVSLNQCYVAGGRFPYGSAQQLRMARASLLSRPHLAETYPEIVDFVQRHSEPDDAIYAAPDCPEVYFLANRRNPTRTMYDFFDTTENRTDRLLEMLESRNINVVVVSVKPEFSAKMDKRLQLEIKKRFPNRKQVGQFVVACRENVRREPPCPTDEQPSQDDSDVAADSGVEGTISDAADSATKRSQS